MCVDSVQRLTECSHSIQAVDNAEVVELGAVVDDGVAERLEVLMLQDLSPIPLQSASRGLGVCGVPCGLWRGRGLQKLSYLLQGDGVMVVGDFGGVLSDPAEHLVRPP